MLTLLHIQDVCQYLIETFVTLIGEVSGNSFTIGTEILLEVLLPLADNLFFKRNLAGTGVSVFELILRLLIDIRV